MLISAAIGTIVVAYLGNRRRLAKVHVEQPKTIINPFSVPKEKQEQHVINMNEQDDVVFTPVTTRKERALTVPPPTIESLRMSQRISSRDLLPPLPPPEPFIINNKKRDLSTKFVQSGRNVFKPLVVRTP